MIILDRQKSTETMKLCLSSSRKYLFVVVNQPFYQVVYRPNIFNPSSWLKTGLKALIWNKSIPSYSRKDKVQKQSQVEDFPFCLKAPLLQLLKESRSGTWEVTGERLIIIGEKEIKGIIYHPCAKWWCRE